MKNRGNRPGQGKSKEYVEASSTAKVLSVMDIPKVPEDDMRIGIASLETLAKYSSKLIKLDGQVQGRKSRILLDSGASCNFISPRLVKKGECQIKKLDKSYQVRLADGRIQEVTDIACNVPVAFKGFDIALLTTFDHNLCSSDNLTS